MCLQLPYCKTLISHLNWRSPSRNFFMRISELRLENSKFKIHKEKYENAISKKYITDYRKPEYVSAVVLS